MQEAIVTSVNNCDVVSHLTPRALALWCPRTQRGVVAGVVLVLVLLHNKLLRKMCSNG